MACNEAYLGDGVYVSHDGYHILLSLEQRSEIKIALGR